METMLHEKLKDEVFQLKVAYLADFFAEVNCLNLQLQGNEVKSLKSQDKVAAFHRKIQLCLRRVQSKDITVFSALTNLMAEKKAECTFISDISEHLKSMDETIKSYFPNLDQREKNSWILKPFSSELENVIDDTDTNAKIEFLSLCEETSLKIEYKEQELCNFFGKLGNEYSILSERPLKFLFPLLQLI